MGMYLTPLTCILTMVKMVNFLLYFTQLFKKREREREVEWMALYISQPGALNEWQHLELSSSPQEGCSGEKRELRDAQMSRFNVS